MTPEQLKQIHAAFSDALSQEPSDRARYLHEVFAQDPPMREEIARLLRDVEETDCQYFLQEPAWIIDDIPLFLPNFKNGDSEYSRIEYIGHGGMGVVYKVYQSNLDWWIALKMSSPDHLTSSGDRERFRTEAQSMARLKHPNIVTVHETGEYQGRSYFTMELIEGKSLNDLLADYAERPRDAANLLETVAQAVHHAHQRRVLHNDLKPANILLDEEETPYVTDFGLAKRLGEDAEPPSSGAVEGTASYMSPEQAAGDEEITTASDVYGLGAILYALLTGRPPFRGETVRESLRLVREEIPEPPSTLNPKVNSDLEAICLKCLSKDKDQRYGSGDALAQDLVRYRTGEETVARPWSRAERFVRWCQRNPAVTSLVGTIVLISILTVTMALFVARARREAQLGAALRSNSFAATDLATTAVLQLRNLSRTVGIAADDGKLVGLLAKDDRDGLRQYLEEIAGGRPSPFTSCFILNRNGVMVARVRPGQPNPDDLSEDSFRWRDYFQGAERHMGQRDVTSIHISSVYRGKSDDLYKFAISAPIWEHQGKFLGVIATSVTTDATMGLVHVTDPSRVWALIAPKDVVDSAEVDRENHLGEYVILFHPAYRPGVPAIEYPDMGLIARRVKRDHTRELDLPDSSLVLPPDGDYSDPVSSTIEDYEGRWIAGFAPVGNTGLTLIVQQRFEKVVGLDPSVLWNLAFWSALISFLAIAIVGMVLWRLILRRRPV